MLHAIDQNKAGRNFHSDEGHWREVFKTSEDSLTSSVFERLFYLPVELFWKIFISACNGNSLPEVAGKIDYFEFWPHWSVSDDGENSNFVEPDLFIRFKTFDLIIESKRWDRKQQRQEQWKEEISAYKKEYEEDARNVYFIALGGIHHDSSEKIEGVEVIKCRWKNLLNRVKDAETKLALTSDIIHSNAAISRILEDIISAFRIHGFSTGKWFDSFHVDSLRLTTHFEDHLKNLNSEGLYGHT